jgi:hypothetical protein
MSLGSRAPSSAATKVLIPADRMLDLLDFLTDWTGADEAAEPRR